ncbi:MAG: hypothetical protein WBX01_13725 [Nitrososphaeraceae archaeon]|jgi:hypothetical protein
MKIPLQTSIVGTVFVLILLATCVDLQESKAAALITVPTDYPTIQSAIDAASPRDTIKVLPGIYTEQLTIGKSITLVGSGAESTTIKAPVESESGVLGIPNIIKISFGSEVTMKGFTISGFDGTSCGAFSLDSLNGADLGVHLDSSAITDCNFVAAGVVFMPTSVLTTQSEALASIPISMPLSLPNASN